MSGAAETLKARLRTDLKVAMQERRSADAKLLRVVLAAIDNAEAVPVEAGPQTHAARFGDGSSETARRMLTAEELDGLLEAEIASRFAAAQDYERGGRVEDAERLRAESEIVRRYLSTRS